MKRFALAALLVSLVALTAPRASAQMANEKTTPAMTAAEKEVVQNERDIYDVLQKQDWAKFASMVDGITYIDMNGITPTMKTADMMEGLNGLVTKSYELTNVRTRMVTPNVMLLTYTVAVDQTANGQHVPSPIHSMSVWQKKGNKWVPIAHSETTASDAK